MEPTGGNKELIVPMKPFSANGFSLIELMIVIGIFGILVAIAIPSYQTYTRKAHYTEIIQAAAPYKLGVEECFQRLDDLEHCKNGENGVPPNIPSGQGPGLVNSITVDNHGVITITPKGRYGITAQDTYVLTPTVEYSVLVWSRSGGAVKAGYAN